MRRVGLSARRSTAWSALTGVEAPRGGRGRPRHEQALSGAPESDAHTLPRSRPAAHAGPCKWTRPRTPRPAAHAGPCKWTRPRTPPARVHRRLRLRRPARALRVAAPRSAQQCAAPAPGPVAGGGALHPPPHLPPPLAPLPSPSPLPRPQDRPGSLESRRNGAVTSGGGGIRATRREEKCVITFPTLLHQEFSLEIRVFLK